MRKIYSLVCASLFLLAGTTACDDGSLSHDDVYIPEPVILSDEDDGYSGEPTTESVLRIKTDEKSKYQQIDGFGCAFGWSEAVYGSTKREQMMDDLYGDNGLRFNIYRGEVHWSYVTDAAGNTDFGMNRNYQISPTSAEMKKYEKTGYWLTQSAQLWLIDYLCKKKYDDIYYFFSVWSPPGIWKKDADPNDPSIGGSFDSKFNNEYTKFLLDFVEAYNKKFNIKIYGISGWNEPDQAMGGWAGCKWEYKQMADYVCDYLRPELNKRNLGDTKIIYGELPWWANSVTWAENSLAYREDLKNAGIVAAGHGYSTVASNIKAMTTVEKAGIHVWQTETCDDKTRDETWNDAMKWAKNYHDYLTKARTNAVVWWAGARYCTSTGENLLQLDTWDFSSSYYRVDRYYSIGQFSRYIDRGAIRVGVDKLSTASHKIPRDLNASAYIKDDTYTIVLVNSSKTKDFDALLEIDENQFESMISYTSSASVKWLRKKLNPSISGKRSVTVPKYSVVTIKGKLKEKGV